MHICEEAKAGRGFPSWLLLHYFLWDFFSLVSLFCHVYSEGRSEDKGRCEEGGMFFFIVLFKTKKKEEDKVHPKSPSGVKIPDLFAQFQNIILNFFVDMGGELD